MESPTVRPTSSNLLVLQAMTLAIVAYVVAHFVGHEAQAAFNRLLGALAQ